MNLLVKVFSRFKALGWSAFPSLEKSLVHRLKAALFDEVNLVYEAFCKARRTGLMLDVGACFGSSTVPFAKRGWKVHAFEPDPNNCSQLLNAVAKLDNVTFTDFAASELDG